MNTYFIIAYYGNRSVRLPEVKAESALRAMIDAKRAYLQGASERLLCKSELVNFDFE